MGEKREKQRERYGLGGSRRKEGERRTGEQRKIKKREGERNWGRKGRRNGRRERREVGREGEGVRDTGRQRERET